MTAVPPFQAAHQSVEERNEERNKRPTFNYYPLLGVLLAIVTAVLTYGGLFLLLADDWSFFQSAEVRKPK